VSLFRGNVDIHDPDFKPLPEEEMEVIDKVARWMVQKWGAAGTMLSIMVGESMKPANFITSQAMVFFEPIVAAFLDTRQYKIFYSALEKRESVEIFLQKVEEYDAVAKKHEKASKVWYRYQKQKMTWYQRVWHFIVPGTKRSRWAVRAAVLRRHQLKVARERREIDKVSSMLPFK
jgi:hypothetical protein